MSSAVPAASGAAGTAVDFPTLVSPQWLHERLGQVKVLDGSWYMPHMQRDALAEYKAERIPGAHFFDVDHIADPETSLPHMLPSDAQFAAAADALGISQDDGVVVYDGAGIFSAPRVWWTWRVFGHPRVAVLDGGLPAWKAAGYEVETTPVDEQTLQAPVNALRHPPAAPRYPARQLADQVRSWSQVLHNISSPQEQLVDARPEPRWRGEAPEPRPGLPSGHIPGSRSLQFANVLESGRYKQPEDLRAAFQAAGMDLARPVVFSCGSGTTACILALALQQAQPGKPFAIYDGSWTEWAQRDDLPREPKT